MATRSQSSEPRESGIRIGTTNAGSDCRSCEPMLERVRTVNDAAHTLKDALGVEKLPFITSRSACEAAGVMVQFVAYTDALRERNNFSAGCDGAMVLYVAGMQVTECGNPTAQGAYGE